MESSKVVLGEELGLGPAGICTWAEMPGSERGLLSGHGLDLRDEVARVHHAVADGGHELLEGDESVALVGLRLRGLEVQRVGDAPDGRVADAAVHGPEARPRGDGQQR